MVSSYSEVRLEILFYEGSNRDNVIAKLSINASGSGGVVYSAYAVAGKSIG